MKQKLQSTSKVKVPHFYNGDLKFGIDRLLNYDVEIEVKKSVIHNDGKNSFILDVGEESFFYSTQYERDIDLQLVIGFLRSNNKQVSLKR